MEAIVELLLKNPGELAAFNLTGTQKENIGVHLWLGRRVADEHFDAFRGRARVKDEQRMLVKLQLSEDFFSERGHAGPAAGASAKSPRSAISFNTVSNSARARASNNTK